jgi:hypothetical protein
MTLRLLCSLWDKFWFAPQSPIPVCLFRIALGLVLLEWCWLTAPELLTCYSDNGILRIKTLQNVTAFPVLDLITILPPGDSWVIAFFGVFVIASLFLTFGLFTRLSTIIVYLCLVSFDHRNIMVNHAGVKLMCLAAFYLMFAPADAALSLDRIRRIWSRRIAPPRTAQAIVLWSMRAFQCQWVLLYLHSFWSKLASPVWWDGTALYYVMRTPEFSRFPVPLLADNMLLCNIATWGTLLIEGAAWTFIYFKETRYLVLGSVFLLHLGIEYALNIPMFEHIMFVSLIVFIYPEDLTRLMDRTKIKIADWFGSPAILTFDGAVPVQAKWARTFEQLDILGRLSLVDIAVPESRDTLPSPLPEDGGSGLLLFCRGEWLSSSDTKRALCARLPLCWPLYPVLALLS